MRKKVYNNVLVSFSNIRYCRELNGKKFHLGWQVSKKRRMHKKYKLRCMRLGKDLKNHGET